MESLKYLNALNKIDGVGPRSMKTLAAFFKNGKNIWEANCAKLKQSGIKPLLAEKIVYERKKIIPEKEWEFADNENIHIISFSDENYPILLKEIPSAPYLLYVKGNVSILNSAPAIAVIGSRKFTNYGKQAAYILGKDLARVGIVVVSGLAIGIDSIAHRGTLDGSGATIAVLGSGLDNANIQPRCNFNLAKEIINKQGALVSDYSPGTPASPKTFPARNRIIAGLTLGTVIVEAGNISGSLITAQNALNFNREVFAVPGSIFSTQSEGTNELIKQGAKLIKNVNDILEELNLEKQKNITRIKKILPESLEEELIFRFISKEPLHIDKIVKLTKLKINIVSGNLSLMEIKGMIKNIGGQNYIAL